MTEIFMSCYRGLYHDILYVTYDISNFKFSVLKLFYSYSNLTQACKNILFLKLIDNITSHFSNIYCMIFYQNKCKSVHYLEIFMS